MNFRMSTILSYMSLTGLLIENFTFVNQNAAPKIFCGIS